MSVWSGEGIERMHKGFVPCITSVKSVQGNAQWNISSDPSQITNNNTVLYISFRNRLKVTSVAVT